MLPPPSLALTRGYPPMLPPSSPALTRGYPPMLPLSLSGTHPWVPSYAPPLRHSSVGTLLYMLPPPSLALTRGYPPMLSLSLSGTHPWVPSYAPPLPLRHGGRGHPYGRGDSRGQELLPASHVALLPCLLAAGDGCSQVLLTTVSARGVWLWGGGERFLTLVTPAGY